MNKLLILMLTLFASTTYADNVHTDVYDYQRLMAQAENQPLHTKELLKNGITFEVQSKEYKFSTFKNILILSKGENADNPQNIKLLGLYFDSTARPVLKHNKTTKVHCANNQAKIDEAILISLEQCKIL